MNNPLRILQTLDHHLAAPTEITLFAFLLTREPLTADQLRDAFARARVPDIPETHALFLAAQPRVLALADGRPGGTPSAA